MLTRSSQVGEFYIMMAPQVPPMGDSTKYTADMMIYDEEKDQHVRIPWADALGACCVDNLDPNTPVSCGNGETMSLANWKDAADEVTTYNNGEKAWAQLSENAKKVRIVVARPFIEHLMVSRRPLIPIAHARASDSLCLSLRSTT